MSFTRTTLALFIGIAISAPAIAQSPPLIEISAKTEGLAYIQNTIDSLDSAYTTDLKQDQVVTNLDEHPVHAMRRREAARKARQQAAKPKTLNDIAKAMGLHGQWRVLSATKDGLFSEAQIGQQSGDTISLLPKEAAPGLLSFG